MPVVGIYTKDFPAIGRALVDTDIVVVDIPGDQVTYRSTVGALNDFFVVANATTTELTTPQLVSFYPNADLGFEVICENITGNPLIYKKGASSWYSIPLGGVSATT